jgi:phage terminase Nu1 subunit (DNA packaging protein)
VDTQKISGPELAKLLGVHERTIRDLAKDGYVVKIGRSAYDRDASITRYCTHLREIAAGRGGESGVMTLTAERARLAREQADSAAIKNAAARGELVPATQVAATWRTIMTGVRARILAVPSRVRLALPHMTRAEVEIIEREVRDALTESANG